jgi:hypothetical protein
LFASKCIRASGAAVAAWLVAATPAAAHGFGERYELPLPLWLYLTAAAATVVASFLIVGLYAPVPRAGDYPRFDLMRTPVGRLLAQPALSGALKALTLALFLLVIAAGLFGNQNPYRNIAPTAVWIVWWVGLAFLSALMGDIWAVVNPWRTTFEAAERLWRRQSRRSLSLRLPYPEALGVWPAAILLLSFSWIELVYPSPAVPSHLALFVLAYTAFTWLAMFLFGATAWLRHGEVFSVVFALLARFAPTEMRVKDPVVCAHCEAHCLTAGRDCVDCYDCFRRARPEQREFALRPFAAGLLGARSASSSMVALVLLLLSVVLFDGLLGTPEWAAIESAAAGFFAVFGERQSIALKSAGLIFFWVLFLVSYLAVCDLMRRSAGSESAGEIARSFAYTLVPIAIGYHIAHYLVFLLVQGQYIIPLISDPLGFGWNLFGTAGYRADIAIVGARFSWYSAVIAVLAGHLIAVYLAHLKAIQVFGLRDPAFRSQIPLTALMVVYTGVSLSLLAEPIVERRAAEPIAGAGSELTLPEAALIPEPGTGLLRRAGPGRTAKQKLTYRLLGSSFHDGTRASAADLIYSYSFAFRWGARGDDGDRFDPAVAAATEPLRRQLVGVHVLASDVTSRTFRVADITFVREILAVEVYADTISSDPDRDGRLAPPWSTLPWHMIALMEEAVGRGWAAFSQAEAERRGVEWLDLVRSETLKPRLAALVEAFERDGFRPAALHDLVGVDEARKRWAALAAYFKANGHFLVTNGPYRLKQWSPTGAVLEAFRDLTYPLGVGSYDAYANPRRGYIVKVDREGDRLTIFADLQRVERFQRDFRLVRVAMQGMQAEELRRAALECRYVVLDASGQIVLADTLRPAADATFRVDFEGRLRPGEYTFLALVSVNENVANADISRVPLVIRAR